MATRTPPSRRRFAHEWDEIKYLYQKLVFWLYKRGDLSAAARFGRRLDRLLKKADAAQESILGQECRALIAEAKGDLPCAIRHREREIAKIKRLWEISRNTPGWDIVTREYGPSDFSDRLDLLAILYRDSGDLETAIRILNESEAFCKSEGVPFDGADVLQDFLAELPEPSTCRRAPRNGQRSRVTNSSTTTARGRRLAQSNR